MNIGTDQARTAIITHEGIYLGPTAEAAMHSKALDTLIRTFYLIDSWTDDIGASPVGRFFATGNFSL